MEPLALAVAQIKLVVGVLQVAVAAQFLKALDERFVESVLVVPPYRGLAPNLFWGLGQPLVVGVE